MNFYIKESEILESELDKVLGERLTKIKCYVCKEHLSEKDLSEIRYAGAPKRHCECK